jgi:hypothetical protein
MQGINLNKILVDGIASETARYTVFYFDGIMPNTLGDLGFDPLNVQELFENSVCHMTTLLETQVHEPNKSTIQLGRSDTVRHAAINAAAGFRNLPAERLIPLPYATGSITENPVDWTQISSESGDNWRGLRIHDNVKHPDLLGTYRRVGREGSSFYTDTGSTLYRKLTPRIQLWFEVAPADDTEWLTLEPWIQSYIEAQYPTTYDTSTLAFVQEDSFEDELGQSMAIRRYAVDLLSDGTPVEIRFRYLTDANVATGVTEPYFAPALKQTWTGEAGFNFVSVHVRQIHADDEAYALPVHVAHFQFYQRSISSRQKRPSWSGSATYSTRCTHIDLYTWDPALNGGAGGWEQHLDYVNVNSTNANLSFPPVSLENNRIRLLCADGPINNGFNLVSGDPHWSLANLMYHADTGVDLYGDGYTLFSADIWYKSDDPALRELTWALIVPMPDDSVETDRVIGSSKQYIGSNIDVPLIMCDVGGDGSGAAIEMERTHTVPLVVPNINQFNIEINSGQGSSSTPPDPDPEPSPVYQYYYSINVASRMTRYATVEDMWSDTNGELIGVSRGSATDPLNLNRDSRIFRYQGTYYFLRDDTSDFYSATSIEGLWQGEYTFIGTSPVWNETHQFIETEDGRIAVVDQNNIAQIFDNIPAMIGDADPDSENIPYAWAKENEVFRDNDTWYVVDSSGVLHGFGSFTDLAANQNETVNLGTGVSSVEFYAFQVAVENTPIPDLTYTYVVSQQGSSGRLVRYPSEFSAYYNTDGTDLGLSTIWDERSAFFTFNGKVYGLYADNNNFYEADTIEQLWAMTNPVTGGGVTQLGSGGGWNDSGWFVALGDGRIGGITGVNNLRAFADVPALIANTDYQEISGVARDILEQPWAFGGRWWVMLDNAPNFTIRRYNTFDDFWRNENGEAVASLTGYTVSNHRLLVTAR